MCGRCRSHAITYPPPSRVGSQCLADLPHRRDGRRPGTLPGRIAAQTQRATGVTHPAPGSFAVRSHPDLNTDLHQLLRLRPGRDARPPRAPDLRSHQSDISALREEHNHRLMRVLGKGGKVVLVRLPPTVARAGDRRSATGPAGRSCSVAEDVAWTATKPPAGSAHWQPRPASAYFGCSRCLHDLRNLNTTEQYDSAVNMDSVVASARGLVERPFAVRWLIPVSG